MRASLFAALSTLPFTAFAQSLVVGPGDNLGAIVETPFIDDFVMIGGTIQSLAQGDGHDTFTMSDGRIIGAFIDGDVAFFSGGRIGRVDLKLDDNLFDMSGGTIDANLVSGFGNDTIILSGGGIGGNISTSGGVDTFTISGGQLKGNLLASFGKDVLDWRGGEILGTVDMGPDDDRATLRGLNSRALEIVVNGGAGQDTLTFDSSQANRGRVFTQWETINLSNASTLTLDDTLTLGDSVSATGVLNIDASSSLIAQSGAITAFTSSQPASLTNAGTIDLSRGGDAQGRLTINGNYTGNGGTLKLNTVLAGDDAASDRLVVNQGSISGTTNLQINNVGGTGGATRQNGIQVVEAASGATSDARAFVQTQVLRAGAFDYRLVKGGVTAGSEHSWYLVSSLSAPPAPRSLRQPPPDVPVDNPAPLPTDTPEPLPPATTPPIVAPAPGQPDLPTPAPGQSIPLYSPEVATYAAAPRAAALIGRFNLGTFHQRRGDQSLINSSGALPGSWAQVDGYSFHQRWSGTVSPSLDGSLYGFKVGQDLYTWLNDNADRQNIGLYVSHSRLEGDVRGFSQGRKDRATGDLKLNGDSVGVYWTLISPTQWYIDAVLQFTDLGGRARSDRGSKLDLDGQAWSASVEMGYPVQISPHWSLEPQAQVIAQRTRFDRQRDPVVEVDFDSQTELTSRLGVRLEGDFKIDSVRWAPFAQLNLWQAGGGHDTLTFDGVDQVKTNYRYSAIEVEAGVVTQLSSHLNLHLGINHRRNLSSEQQEGSGVNAGVSLVF